MDAGQREDPNECCRAPSINVAVAVATATAAAAATAAFIDAEYWGRLVFRANKKRLSLRYPATISC